MMTGGPATSFERPLAMRNLRLPVAQSPCQHLRALWSSLCSRWRGRVPVESADLHCVVPWRLGCGKLAQTCQDDCGRNLQGVSQVRSMIPCRLLKAGRLILAEKCLSTAGQLWWGFLLTVGCICIWAAQWHMTSWFLRAVQLLGQQCSRNLRVLFFFFFFSSDFTTSKAGHLDASGYLELALLLKDCKFLLFK